ncbi:MAG: YaaA family protein [Spirochaetales bacterium]|nr:YaaA family protein [Spirochaetales bacterium]
MIILISPAKTMDFTNPFPDMLSSGTVPPFQKEAEFLNHTCLRERNTGEIASLMRVSEDLAEKTVLMNRAFGSPGNPVRPALFAYRGAVFQNIDPLTLNDSSLDFASAHLRILSALYGCLRPGDWIEPYRLDMKIPLEPEEKCSLTDFWREPVTSFINKELEGGGHKAVLNLASGEFSRVLDRKKLAAPLITVNFKEMRKGRLVTVGTYAKMARGRMARRILEERVRDRDTLKEWEIMGYRYNEEASGEGEMLFYRE